jgi:aminopeptidase N
VSSPARRRRAPTAALRLGLGPALLAGLGFAIDARHDACAEMPRAAAAVLTMQQARERADRVSDVAYDLTLELDGQAPAYGGRVVVTFSLADADRDMTLDFTGGRLAGVDVNGAAVDTRYNGFFLTLPAASLKRGTNRVDVRFSHPYSTDGSGLYRFEDPEDGRDYLYTDFEPYHQNRLFPSFDQPALKARFTSTVTVPATWQVISNVAESAVVANGDKRTWTFPRSPPISTYLFALHAGEYHVWKSSAGDVPLRLFARESLAKYVEADKWFTYTREGLAFYAKYFDLPYPFGKYDQIIVPHFNAGAMENAGAVTFSERYLRRGPYARQDRRAIASTILHEMAHMWFGDLVTMDWWNGLWLNESFAEFMSVLAMNAATEFTDQWLESYRATLQAYDADERDTTHPIEQPTPDTDAAFANFDAITYEKGSATLSQLNYFVGPEAFRRGVGNYLKAHAYDNTDIEDFLGAVSAAAGRDLEDWANEWLRTAGADSVAAEVGCRQGRIATLELVQTAPEAWPTLRVHRTQVGLYDFGADKVGVRTIPVTYDGPRTVVDAARGQRCPDMVYPNHGAWDYVRVRLDPQALRTLGEHLSGFGDPLTRLMLWQNVWDMVQDARLPVTGFLDFALAHLDDEPNETVERQVLSSLEQAVDYLVAIEPAAESLAVYGPRVENYLWQRLAASAPGSDRQLLLLDSYVRAVTSEAGVKKVAALLDGSATLPGLTIDPDRRWTLLQTLSAHGYSRAPELIAAERKRDGSDEGRLRALAAEAAAPDEAVKRRWVKKLLDPAAETTLAEFRAVARGLFPRNQTALRLKYTADAIAALPRVERSRDPEFYSPLIFGVLKPVCSRNYLDEIDRAVSAAQSLHPQIRQDLKDIRFDVTRCLKVAAELRAAP